MIKRICSWTIALAAVASAGPVFADDFNVEFGLGFEDTRIDVSTAIDLNFFGSPQPAAFVTSSDQDDIRAFGRWYYTSASDSSGPLSRAAFVSRASSVGFGYTRGDASFSASILPPPTVPLDTGVSSSSDEFSVDVRHVWRESGWFVSGEVSRLDVDTTFPQVTTIGIFGTPSLPLPPGPVFEAVPPAPIGAPLPTFDATSYSIGVGKYVGATTSLAIDVAQVDSDLEDFAVYAASFKHLGSIGSSWQYGIDAGVLLSDLDADDGTYLLGVSLYPVPQFEFGLSLEHERYDGFLDTDSTSYVAFASWFARRNLAFALSYGVTDQSDGIPNSSRDEDAYSFGFRLRY